MKDSFINKNVYTYLKGTLKSFNFTENDLKFLENLNMCAFDMGDNFLSNSLEDLKYFPNLKNLEISKYILNRGNINIIESLSKLENFTLKYIDIKDKFNISGKNLVLSNCQKIYNINFDFENITIENCDIRDLAFYCKNLKLNHCVNFEKSKISSSNIEFYLMNLNDIEVEIIKNLSQNSKIVINNCKFKENSFDNMKNIKILNSVEGENIG